MFGLPLALLFTLAGAASASPEPGIDGNARLFALPADSAADTKLGGQSPEAAETRDCAPDQIGQVRWNDDAQRLQVCRRTTAIGTNANTE